MRERAHLAGGWLTAGPDGEHFRVAVFIPYGTREARGGDDTVGAAARGAFGAHSGSEAQPVLAAPGPPGLAMAAREADHRG